MVDPYAPPVEPEPLYQQLRNAQKENRDISTIVEESISAFPQLTRLSTRIVRPKYLFLPSPQPWKRNYTRNIREYMEGPVSGSTASVPLKICVGTLFAGVSNLLYDSNTTPITYCVVTIGSIPLVKMAISEFRKTAIKNKKMMDKYNYAKRTIQEYLSTKNEPHKPL